MPSDRELEETIEILSPLFKIEAEEAISTLPSTLWILEMTNGFPSNLSASNMLFPKITGLVIITVILMAQSEGAIAASAASLSFLTSTFS
ncbi:MAG: hypothetical protein GX664_03445, partial [Bacteroidales bacterium]|nr:hypothetical protein [Bacteroidales bacterium]